MDPELKRYFNDKVIIDVYNKKIRLVGHKREVVKLIEDSNFPTFTHNNRDNIRENISNNTKDFNNQDIIYVILNYKHIILPTGYSNLHLETRFIKIVEPEPIIVRYNYWDGIIYLDNFKYNLEAINSGIIKQTGLIRLITENPKDDYSSMILKEVENEVFN